VYTSPILLPFVAQMLQSFGALDKLQNFVSYNGRAFYRYPPGANARRVVLQKVKGYRVEDVWTVGNETVRPFWGGKEIEWQIIDQ
jgi:dihydroorotase